MRAGALRHRVNIDEPILSQNETGEEETVWTEFDPSWVWGSVQPLNGREALNAGQPLAVLDTRIRVRWSPKTDLIEETWRLRHKAIIYNIISIAHIELRQREIEFMCKSGASDGG